MTALRPELKNLPARIARLPLDPRGYPIPAFVDTVDGVRDFRYMSRAHWLKCIRFRQCWVCGEVLGVHLAFVIGPMCGVNRTTSEPPSHRDCAIWSARFCPFLSRPHMVRREDEGTKKAERECPAAGFSIARNPGVSLVWVANNYTVFDDRMGGQLLRVGDPYEVLWFAEGREATREECEASLRSGLPALEEMARLQEGGEAALREAIAALRPFLPQHTKEKLNTSC